MNDDIYISCYLNSKNIKRRVVRISDVKNNSGSDALSADVFKFFNSLDKAINECYDLGWIKTRADTSSIETIGFLIFVIILALLAIFILILYLYKYLI